MFKKFKTNYPAEVEAVLLTKENLQEVINYIGKPYSPYFNDDYNELIGFSLLNQSFYVGQYVCKTEDGKFYNSAHVPPKFEELQPHQNK